MAHRQPTNPQAAEGWAAFTLGVGRDANPYRDHALATDESGAVTHTSEWDRGWDAAQLSGKPALDVRVEILEHETALDGRVRSRYRIVGEPTGPSRTIHPSSEPWCEFTMYDDADHLLSYGGELWPTAWPELFQPAPPSPQAGSAGVRVTKVGLALLAQTRRLYELALLAQTRRLYGPDSEAVLRAERREREAAEGELEEARKAIRLVLAIEADPTGNPETIKLCPASRRQLIGALGPDGEEQKRAASEKSIALFGAEQEALQAIDELARELRAEVERYRSRGEVKMLRYFTELVKRNDLR